MEQEGPADADRGWVLRGSRCARELAQGGLCAIKKINLGESTVQGLVLHFEGTRAQLCGAEASTGRFAHKQHPELPKQPSLIFIAC